MDLASIDKNYVLQTYARNYVNFKSGINATLVDEDGLDYIDFTSGIGVVSIGHGNEKLANALCEQARSIIHISNLYLIEPQARLAKKIVELSGYDMACFFANSGAEANEGAIKIARKYGKTKFDNKKYKIISLEHSFHGRTITTLKATGQGSMHLDDFAPYPDGFDYNKQIDDIYNSIDNETVAVMIELVQGEGGVNPFDKKKVQELAKFLKEKEILLIVDEVQTGVYRTGKFLASQVFEIEPDIITLAKGLGGGVPIGVVMTKHKDLLKAGEHGSTFGGNFLSTTAGLVVLEELKNYKNSGKLDEIIEYFDKKLNNFAKKIGEKEVVGIGLMRGIRMKSEEMVKDLINKAFKERVLVLKAGKNTVRFLPPLTIGKDEIDLGFERLDKCI